MRQNSIIRLLLSAALAFAASVSFADSLVGRYDKAYRSQREFASSNVFYDDVNAVWLADGSAFWYVRKTPDGPRYVVVDAVKRKRRPLFREQLLGASLAKATGKEVDSDRLSLDRLRVSACADTLWFEHSGRRWEYLPAKDRLTDAGTPEKHRQGRHWMEVDDEKGADPVLAPDGSREAFIRESNVWVRDIATGKERQLSNDGTAGNYYSSWLQWSPDGTMVASCRIRPAEKRYVYYVESSPSDQLQPRLR